MTLPDELADDIMSEAGQMNPFGSIRVEATINATTWRTSLFPDKSRGSLLLPVKKQVRRVEDLFDGSTCHVTLSTAAPMDSNLEADAAAFQAG